LQGEQYSKPAAALRDGDLNAADLTPKHRLLLEFVETLTRHAYRITDEQVQHLRDAGWSDRRSPKPFTTARSSTSSCASPMPSTSIPTRRTMRRAFPGP
jgi:predicted NAD/FAD-dependent oxidoreductase